MALYVRRQYMSTWVWPPILKLANMQQFENNNLWTVETYVVSQLNNKLSNKKEHKEEEQNTNKEIGRSQVKMKTVENWLGPSAEL